MDVLPGGKRWKFSLRTQEKGEKATRCEVEVRRQIGRGISSRWKVILARRRSRSPIDLDSGHEVAMQNI